MHTKEWTDEHGVGEGIGYGEGMREIDWDLF